MALSRKGPRGGKALAFPLFGIVILLAFYFVLSEWQDLPNMIGNAISSMHWSF